MKMFRWLLAAVVAVTVLPAGLLAQQRGIIAGQVTAQPSGEPLAGANIHVQGTALRTVTDAQGRFRMVNVPAGNYTVTAAIIGRETANRPVAVTAGGTATVTFALAPSVTTLEGLVVTATGEQQRSREVGNAVGKINVAEDVPMAAVNDVSQVLMGRTAGVTVLQASGTTGTGARIRIRGSNSVSLSNDPLLIIDGVRVDNASTNSIGVGGQDTNRLNDLNAEDIESMEVLKGPAASALYGTAAANGVIVVTTKKGRAGSTRFSAYTEQGRIEEVADYPGNFNARTATGRRCLIAVRGEPCTDIQSFNPLEDPQSTPFQDGARRKYGASVSGGSELATYFVSGDIEDEEGIYKFDASNLDRISLRANVRGQPTEQLSLTVNTGYINSDLRLPQNDNNILGIISGGLLSRRTEFSEANCGFLVLCPEAIAAIDTRQTVERITGSGTVTFRPIPWLNIVGVAGLDRVNRFDHETTPPERVFFGSLPEGERVSNRIQISNYTANLSGTASYGISENITGQTSVGTQYTEEIFRGTFASGARLLAGVPTLGGTTTRFAVNEQNNQVRTVGGFFQQQIGLNDRFFLTGAIRADDNSAFGQDFGLVYYPSLSASWVVAEEPWFPQFDVLSSFRLRAAYGESGLRPGQLDAVQFLNPVAVTTGTGISSPGFTFGGTGNVNLRPEKSREVELGFDLALLEERVGFEATYYNKRSADALISRRLPPSLGVSTSRFENLGEVQNRGLELLFNTRIFQGPRFGLDATVTSTWTENELTDIGIDPGTNEPIPPIIFGLGGNSQRHAQGLPLGGYYGTPFTFADANNNGIIEVNEVELGDSATFLGSAFPTREASFQTNATLFRVIKLTGLLDYRGGYKQFNSTEEFRCGSFFNCQALYDADVSLERQAAAVATAFYDTPAGYIEDASFVKLRELSVSLVAPTSLTDRLRLRSDGLRLTLAGRNLKTWTDYSGLDPEINFAGTGSNFTTAEFLTQPPVRYYTLRLDVTF